MSSPSNSDHYFNIVTLKSISEINENKTFNFQKAHRVKYYKILIITNGIGQHNIDFKKHDFSTGIFVFTAKNQVQSYDFKPGNSGYIITFSESFLNETIRTHKGLSKTWLYNFHFNKPTVQVVAKEQEYFVTLTERIFQEFNKKDGLVDDEIIQALLNLLLLNSERIKKEELLKSSNLDYCNIFFSFKNLVETKYSATRNATYYADELKISYKHLNNICKQFIKKTAKQFIDDFIVLEAKRCLLTSNMSVKEITKHTGFDESTNFVKYFKKHTKLSPVQFRNRYSQ